MFHSSVKHEDMKLDLCSSSSSCSSCSSCSLSVVSLQEFYGDFIAVNPHLFSLNLHGVARVRKHNLSFTAG